MPDEGRKNSMIDTEGNLGKRTVKTTLALLVVFVMVATAFAAVGYALQRSRADIMADVPLQWQKNVNAAIESGELPSDVTGAQVKDWLAAKMLTVSDKVKDSYVNPLNAKAVAEREAASASGSEPPAVAGTGKILVVLLEFAGSDTYKGVTYTGPMHNTIPQPPAENNVDYWMSDFAPSHYYDLLFGKKRGSLANYLKEQSGGLYTVDGYVTDWVQIKDHSQWYYGADTRTGGAGSDDLNGPVWRIAIDAAKAAYDQYGMSIPWYDFDTNGDGWIDSLMVIRAGQEQEPGPAWYIWGHSWFANWPAGYEIVPGLKVGSYTCEAEDGTLGLFAHEYAHQLGLPDEYDRTYIGESPTGFWSLMSSGMWNPGPTPDGRSALGVLPSHMNVWSKSVLGWENGATAYVDYSSGNAVSSTITMSQVEGSRGIRAVKVELPAKAVTLPLPSPHSGTYQWYSGYKPDVTDVMGVEWSSYMMTATIPSVPVGATLSFWEWWDIEQYYDWGSVQVSADGGMTWSTLAGMYTTTADPIGSNPGNGITGTARKVVQESMDLSAYAGVTNLLLRFELNQDGGVYGLGWTVDDVTVVGSDGTVAFQDMVDPSSTALWTISASDNMGSGWNIATAGMGGSFRQYYIMEWRNFVGYDIALWNTYQYVGLYVKYFSHNQGLAIWYRDLSMGDNDYGLHPGHVAIGLVDAHPQPLYMANGFFVRERIQLADATFGLRSTFANTITLAGVPTTFPSLAAQPTFDDRNQFFYSQFYKGTSSYLNMDLPTYGVKVTVLSERAGLTGATILVDAAPL
jgi:immune inhibitor A